MDLPLEYKIAVADTRSRINQLFFLNKCVKQNGTAQEFYDYCKNPPFNTSFVAECSDLEKAAGSKCLITLNFKPHELWDDESCWLGKEVTNNYRHYIDDDIYNLIKKNCLHWREGGRPITWWVLLLIILAIVILVSFGAALIWTYWLKKRWYQRKPQSTLTSRWTSSPVSSTASSAYSEIPSTSGVSSTRPSGSQYSGASSRPSGMPYSGSARPIQQPSRPPLFGTSGRANSVYPSAAPSAFAVSGARSSAVARSQYPSGSQAGGNRSTSTSRRRNSTAR